MATIDRIEPASYTPWSPATSGFPTSDTAQGVAPEYHGRHRRLGARGLGLLRMFYSGRHRRRS